MELVAADALVNIGESTTPQFHQVIPAGVPAPGQARVLRRMSREADEGCRQQPGVEEP